MKTHEETGMNIATALYWLALYQPDGETGPEAALQTINRNLATMRDTGLIEPESPLSDTVSAAIRAYVDRKQNGSEALMQDSNKAKE